MTVDSNIRFKVDLDNREATKNADKFNASLKNMSNVAMQVGVAMAAVAGAGIALKKVFDIGRQGAVIQQTTESFNRMNESIFMMPGLLNKMGDAVAGTIKDVDLMSGLMTLVAGTSEELSRKFAETSPQLLKIAKAAQKLNPTLGDTAFLYQSIATGIKRASPLILDNLGIVVKIGRANEDYAKSLGKTVQELTATEQQMALLNATLEAGDVLIKQVGGSVDSATDAYDRMGVSISKQIDQGITFLDSVIRPLIDGFLSLDKTISEGTADNAILRGLGNLLLWDRALGDIRGNIDDLLISLGIISEEAKKLPELLVLPEVVVTVQKTKNEYVKLTEKIKELKASLLTVADSAIPRVVAQIAINEAALRKLTSTTEKQYQKLDLLIGLYDRYIDVLDRAGRSGKALEGTMQERALGGILSDKTKGVATPDKPQITMPSESELQESFRLQYEVAQGAAQAIGDTFMTMWEDVFGKANNLFEKMIANIASSLARLATEYLAQQIFGAFLGFATGGTSGVVSAGSAWLSGMSGNVQSSGGGKAVQVTNINLGDKNLAQVITTGNDMASKLRYN